MAANGSQLEGIFRDAGKGIPAAVRALARQPKLTQFQSLFWSSFNDLATERPATFSGATYIPISKIVWYARVYLRMKTDFEVDEFVRVIRAMDAHWVSAQNRAAERNRSGTSV